MCFTEEKYLDNKIDLLKKVHLFSDLQVELLEEIAGKLQEVYFKRDEVIFYKGELGNELYMIVAGKVRVHNHAHTFSVFGEGRIFGEYAIIDTGFRSATVTVLEDVHLLTLSRDEFNKIIANNQEVILGILRILTRQIREKDTLETRLAIRNKEIFEQNKEIAHQKKAIELSNERLKAINKEKNHIINIVAHDLRNPLTSAQSVSSMLAQQEEGLDEDQVEGLKLISRSLKRMDEMVTRILDISKLERVGNPLCKELINLNEVFEEVLHEFNEIASRKEIEIHFESVIYHVPADIDMLKHIIENLLSNSIKFSPRKKNIYISIEGQEGDIVFQIKDEGPGISKSDKQKLFKKFQKLAAKPTEGEATTGLGLSIVKKYTDMLGGKVWCNSEEGKGATFYVSLPKLKTDK